MTQSLVEGTGTGAATSGAARPSCSNYDLGDLTQHQEIYGQSNGDPYVWGWLSEVYGTEHTLGIAAEESGSAWKVSGSANVEISWDKTHTHTSTTPKHAASYQWLNEINFHYWRQNCITITGQQVLTYSWRPSSTYDINTSSRTQSHPYYSYCDDKPSGLTESAGDGVRTSYSLGMEIEGVHLTVSSTYETEVDDEFQWTGPGQFCGDNENGPLNSANVEGVGW